MKKIFLFVIFSLLFQAVRSEAQVTRWYSYADYSYYQSVSLGESGSYYPVILWNDTTAVFTDMSSGSPVYYHGNIISSGVTFTPRMDGWNDPAVYGASIKVGPTDVYVIDSVRLNGVYLRNNAKTAPKDTIKLSFVSGNGTIGTNITNAGLSGGHYGSINFIDLTYDSVKNIAGKSLSGPAPYTQNIILSNTDTATVFSKAYQLTTPFSVGVGQCAGMSMTFKSGDASFFANDTVIYPSGAYKHGEFSPYVQYNTFSPGGPIDWAIYNSTDSNMGFFRDAKSSVTGWAGLYVPEWAWSTSGGTSPSYLQYPMVDFHITCPTCELNDTMTGVKTLCVSALSPLSISYTGGAWSCSNTLVATVSSGGVVAGVGAGTAIITYTLSGHRTTSMVIVKGAPSAGTVTGASSICAGASSFFNDPVFTGTWSSSAPSVAGVSSSGLVSGLTAGTATISYTVTDACGTSYATKAVTINPLPDAGTVTGTATLCVGGTTTLTDAAPGGTWYTVGTGITTVSGGVVSGIAPGTSKIVYEVSNGCGTRTATMTVTVDVLPNAGTLSGANIVCVDSAIALTASVPGGTWGAYNSHAFVNTGIVLGLSAGVDTIKYTITNGCGTAEAQQLVVINDCINAVIDPAAAQDINIRPNPTQDRIIITSSVAIKSVVVSNMIGQVLVSGTYNSSNVTVSMEQFPSGMYMVKINDSKVYKVIKQ